MTLRERGYTLTIALHEEFKNKSDEVWARLMANDISVVEEHTKAGVVIAEWDRNDLALVESIPCVAAVRICVIEAPKPEAPDRLPGKSIKPMKSKG